MEPQPEDVLDLVRKIEDEGFDYAVENYGIRTGDGALAARTKEYLAAKSRLESVLRAFIEQCVKEHSIPVSELPSIALDEWEIGS